VKKGFATSQPPCFYKAQIDSGDVAELADALDLGSTFASHIAVCICISQADMPSNLQ
jgi:hypothetical protein